MASTRRSTSRLLRQIRNTQAQHRLYSNKHISRDYIPETDSRDYNITFDVAKNRHKPFPKYLWNELREEFKTPSFWIQELRKEVKTPSFWISYLIVAAWVYLSLPWPDTPKNREWFEKYGLRWFLVKNKKQNKEEESAGRENQEDGPREDELVEEWMKAQEGNEMNAKGDV